MRRSAQNLLNTAARAIKRAAGENAVSAYFGDGRFATLLVGQSPAAAKTLAESLAKDFGSRESHHESIPRPTLTSAVVPWSPDQSADRFLADALETLQLAELSGGGCVVVHGEFNPDFAAWKEDMSTATRSSTSLLRTSCSRFRLSWNATRCKAILPRLSTARAYRCSRTLIATDDWSAWQSTSRRPPSTQIESSRSVLPAKRSPSRKQLPTTPASRRFTKHSLLAAARRWSSRLANVRSAISRATASYR